MLRIFLIVLLGVVAAGVPALGQESSPAEQPDPTPGAESVQPAPIQVDISFGTGINRVTRSLEGAAVQFSPEVGQIFCFTHLMGLEAPAVVTHAWYHDGKTMAQVDLNIGSADWRTWSSKLVLPGWSGHWEVKVLDAAGKILGSADFELQ